MKYKPLSLIYHTQTFQFFIQGQPAPKSLTNAKVMSQNIFYIFFFSKFQRLKKLPHFSSWHLLLPNPMISIHLFIIWSLSLYYMLYVSMIISAFLTSKIAPSIQKDSQFAGQMSKWIIPHLYLQTDFIYFNNSILSYCLGTSGNTIRELSYLLQIGLVFLS